LDASDAVGFLRLMLDFALFVSLLRRRSSGSRLALQEGKRLFAK